MVGVKNTVPKVEYQHNQCSSNPHDHDGVIKRKEDITYSDETEREEQALLLVSDFVDLARELIKFAKENGVKNDVINRLLERKTMNLGQTIRPRKYSDILVGQFE